MTGAERFEFRLCRKNPIDAAARGSPKADAKGCPIGVDHTSDASSDEMGAPIPVMWGSTDIEGKWGGVPTEMGAIPDGAAIRDAASLADQASLSFWGALVVVAATRAGADSEPLNDGQEILGV